MTTRELLTEIVAIVTDPDVYQHPLEILTALSRVLSGEISNNTICPWPTTRDGTRDESPRRGLND